MILETSILSNNSISFAHSRLFLVGLFFVLIILFSYILPTIPTNLHNTMDAPSFSHWLGTDLLGRDIFQKILIGIRYSTILSISTVLITALIGTGISVMSIGYRFSFSLIYIITQSLIALPPLIICLLLISRWGGGMQVLMIGQFLAFLPVFIKLSYRELNAILQSDFAQIAIGMGNTPFMTVYKHGMPILLPKLRAQILSLLSIAIGIESGLSYLGLGPPLPHTGLGHILHDSMNYWYLAPWYPIATLSSFVVILSVIIWVIEEPPSEL